MTSRLSRALPWGLLVFICTYIQGIYVDVCTAIILAETALAAALWTWGIFDMVAVVYV